MYITHRTGDLLSSDLIGPKTNSRVIKLSLHCTGNIPFALYWKYSFFFFYTRQSVLTLSGLQGKAGFSTYPERDLELERIKNVIFGKPITVIYKPNHRAL